MYIKDIHKSTKSKLIIYAEHITLLYSTKKLNNIISRINDDLDKLKHWFEINKVIVNVKKTSYIIFRSPQHILPLNIPEVKYDNQTLQSCHSTKFLGIHLDSTLSWKNHINHICKRIAVGIHYILRVRNFFPKHILHSIYTSFIETHLAYGIESWGSACPTTLKPLLTLQKRAVRIMHCLPPSASVSEVFAISGILTIHQLAYYRIAILMHKIINEAINITDLDISVDRRPVVLRTTSDTSLSVCGVKTNYGKQKIQYMGCKLWNELDASLKGLKSLSLFSKEVKNFTLYSDANLKSIIK